MTGLGALPGPQANVTLNLLCPTTLFSIRCAYVVLKRHNDIAITPNNKIESTGENSQGHFAHIRSCRLF